MEYDGVLQAAVEVNDWMAVRGSRGLAGLFGVSGEGGTGPGLRRREKDGRCGQNCQAGDVGRSIRTVRRGEDDGTGKLRSDHLELDHNMP